MPDPTPARLEGDGFTLVFPGPPLSRGDLRSYPYRYDANFPPDYFWFFVQPGLLPNVTRKTLAAAVEKGLDAANIRAIGALPVTIGEVATKDGVTRATGRFGNKWVEAPFLAVYEPRRRRFFVLAVGYYPLARAKTETARREAYFSSFRLKPATSAP